MNRAIDSLAIGTLPGTNPSENAPRNDLSIQASWLFLSWNDILAHVFPRGSRTCLPGLRVPLGQTQAGTGFPSSLDLP